MKNITVLIIVLSMLSCIDANSQKAELKRKAYWAFSSKPVDNGILILRVDSGGTIHKLGLLVNDIIQQVDDIPVVEKRQAYSALIQSAREDDPIAIKFIRNGKEESVSGTITGLRKLKAEKYQVVYDWTKFGDGQLRTIVKRPLKQGTVPMILYIPEFPCWILDAFQRDHYAKLTDKWAENGFGIVYVEKTGLGDNHNTPDCEKSDLLTDVENYKAGYKYMQSLPYADTKNLYVYGHGMGGVIAAKLATEENPKGVFVFGTSFRPWSEAWLERLRLHALWSKKDISSNASALRVLSDIFYKFFHTKESPEILYANATYKKVMRDLMGYDPRTQTILGRNAKYWQQLDSFPIPQLWSKVNSYVLSLYGEADYEGYLQADHEMIAETVNTHNPGAASFVSVKNITHNLDSVAISVPDYLQTEFYPKNYNNELEKATLSWLLQTSKEFYTRPKMVIPRDTALVDLSGMAKIITENKKTSYEKVRSVIDWANNTLTWTATDYVNRTVQEIICKRGGNCNEEKKVAAALLHEAGVKTRMIREINIQPENARRQKSSEDLVIARGLTYSVFGLMHNDHVWIEYYDEEKKSWEPADPTTGLVGIHDWLTSRIGFNNRPMHKILLTKDMLVPVYIAVVNENNPNQLIVEDRSEYYLIEAFDKVYNGKLSKLKEWPAWKRLIADIAPKARGAFENKVNLHSYTSLLKEIKSMYEKLTLGYTQ